MCLTEEAFLELADMQDCQERTGLRMLLWAMVGLIGGIIAIHFSVEELVPEVCFAILEAMWCMAYFMWLDNRIFAAKVSRERVIDE